MEKFLKIAIVGIIFATGSAFFFLSFTQFNSAITTQDVVSGEKVFISTNQTAVEKFVDELAEIEKADDDPKSNVFGIGLFVDFKDSNGKIIPLKSNLVPIPYVNALLGENNEPLDFAKFQFDVFGLVTTDQFVDVTVNYEVVSNGKVFLEGRAYGKGVTTDGKLDLDFEQGQKTGEVLELDFEKNEVPVKYSDDGKPLRNTLEIRIINVDAVLGEGFSTQHREWAGSFPALNVKFDADPSIRIIRDYRGIAVQTLPNDIGIQVCGYDDGRLFPSQDFGAFAPTITVKTPDDIVVMTSAQPVWGNRDADFNSLKCGKITSGLERETDYIFIVEGSNYEITTPNSPHLYKAECRMESSGTYQNPKTIFPCKSNFGWSR